MIGKRIYEHLLANNMLDSCDDEAATGEGRGADQLRWAVFIPFSSAGDRVIRHAKDSTDTEIEIANVAGRLRFPYGTTITI